MGFAEFELFVFIKFLIKLFFQILLAIIILLLIVIVSVIFSRINLKLTGSKPNSNIDDNDITKKFLFDLKVSYLFGILKFDFDNTNNTQVIKLFGFKLEKIKYIFKRNKTSNNNSDDSDDSDDLNNSNSNNSNSNNNSDDNNNSEDVLYTTQSINNDDLNNSNVNNYNSDNNNSTDDNPQQSESQNQESTTKKINMEDVQNIYNNKFFQFFKTKIINIQAIIDKIKQVINYPDKVEMLNSIKDSIKSLFKSITFKEISINIDYGLDEPHKTGTIAGIISAVLPVIADTHYETINLNPNFDDEVLVGDFNIECHTTLFRLIKPIINFLINSPIRNLLKNKSKNKKFKK